jgi:glycosyltransferase involved in cell wall biosynthesis
MSQGFKETLHGGQTDGTDNAARSQRAKIWRVIHACEYARDVLPVVEGQVAVGMRPYIVTPQGAGTAELYLSGRKQDQPRALSLLRSWQDVRNWRKSLLDCTPETSSDIVHSHCFAAGMAAVRNCSCVVYDLGACIEEMAMAAELCESGSWMARSFRVAEQFVLTRAAAVIVHSEGLKQAAIERGAPPESIFPIPQPINMDDESLASLPDEDFLTRRFGLSPNAVSFFVPQFAPEDTEELSAAAISMLEGFALASNGLPQFDLLLDAPESVRKAVNEHASRLGVSSHVALVHPFDVPAAMQSAHVIVATGEVPEDPATARLPNEICLKSLWQGKTLLAADVPRNRDASPEGCGCLWFEAGNPRDLGYRMAFLGRKPEFRAALAAAGRMYIFETRSSAAVGKMYDEAYRYAASKRKSGGMGQNIAQMEPAENWG